MFSWFQTQHQDQITSVSASINMTKLSLQMYKLTLYFSSRCINESGGGICLTRAWLVLGVGLLWSSMMVVGAFYLRMFCDNTSHYCFYGCETGEFTIASTSAWSFCQHLSCVWVQASIFMISGAVWRPWPCSCSDHSSWVLSQRRLGPVRILMNKVANLRQMGTNFTI